MTLNDFLNTQEWAVYRLNGRTRKFFGDTAFGPMWKEFPPEVEVPVDLVLDSLLAVQTYMKNTPAFGGST